VQHWRNGASRTVQPIERRPSDRGQEEGEPETADRISNALGRGNEGPRSAGRKRRQVGVGSERGDSINFIPSLQVGSR